MNKDIQTPVIKRVKDYKSGAFLGYAPINWSAYNAYCDHHSVAVFAGEWLWSDELQKLQVTADHSVYFE